jgi:hypothetical protein
MPHGDILTAAGLDRIKEWLRRDMPIDGGVTCSKRIIIALW